MFGGKFSTTLADAKYILQMESKTSPRKPHFTSEEVYTIIEEMEQQYSLLYGAFSANIDHTQKKKAWERIVTKVNAVSSVCRTLSEVKHKWQDLQLKAKKKETQRKHLQGGTGGGPAPKELTSLEEKVIAIIPTICTQGIDGGIDTDWLSQSREASQSAEFQGCNEDQSDKENGILINMATGEEIVLDAPSTPSTQLVPETPVCKTLYRKNKNVFSKMNTTTDPTERLIAMEEEKLRLKREKIELIREQNDIEKKKIKLLQSIDEKLSNNEVDTSCFSFINTCSTIV